MPEFQSAFARTAASSAYTGPTPPPPRPPATPETALSAAAPALDLGLGTVTIIVGGDVDVTTSFTGAIVRRR